jgi:hypothetical protein
MTTSPEMMPSFEITPSFEMTPLPTAIAPGRYQKRVRARSSRDAHLRTCRLHLVAIVAIGTVLLAACGSSPSSAGSHPRSSGSTTSSSSTDNPSGGHKGDKSNGSGSSSTTSTSTTSPFYPKGKIVPKPSTTTTVPEDGGRPVNSYLAAGNQIVIYSSGIWPQTLDANDQVPVTWTNDSGKPQSIKFDSIPVSSSPIPPGAQFVWKADFGGSYPYHTASGMSALLVLQAPTPITIPGTGAKPSPTK